jgi:ubiquinone/menaquinone biosynthesis C-methylase UbiE
MKRCLKCGTKFETENWLCPNCFYQPEIVSGHYVLNPELNKDNLGFRQETFAQLYDIEASNFWFRYRNQIILWAIKKYFPGAKKMLEIGCGTGFVLASIRQSLPGLSLTGSDISSAGLVYAAKRVYNTELVQFDATMIPYNYEFDIVGAFDVLEHIEKDEQVLTQMNKAIVSDGGIIITVPQHQFLWSQTDESASHLRRYSFSQLKKKVNAAGFELVRATSFVSLLFPLMILSRLLKKKQVHKNFTYTELHINRHLNYIFEKVLAFERLVIKFGVNLPFGGSLLIIARKVD